MSDQFPTPSDGQRPEQPQQPQQDGAGQQPPQPPQTPQPSQTPESPYTPGAHGQGQETVPLPSMPAEQPGATPTAATPADPATPQQAAWPQYEQRFQPEGAATSGADPAGPAADPAGAAYPTETPQPEPAAAPSSINDGQTWPPTEPANPTEPAGGFPPVAPAAAPAPTKQKSGPGWGALIASMLATAALVIAGLYGLGALRGSGSTHADERETTSAQSTTPLVQGTSVAPDWEAVAAAVRPATVSIAVASADGSSSSLGSGFIYDNEGHVVTNYHVIATALNGGQVQVTLSDGRLYMADIVGADSSTDLAVIKLQDAPGDLTAAKIGDSKNVTVGEPVMAIGSPLGLSDTVTTGIVSALNRPVQVEQEQPQQEQTDPNDPFSQLPGLPGLQQLQQQQGQTQSQAQITVTNAIQVDASINPGNSGGPLFDASGAVIGVNSSIASNTGSSDSAGSIGLGFAIPSDLAKSVAEQLITTGKVDHALLGVSIKSGTATVDGATRVGAEISAVNPGSGAEQAGLQVGDVVLDVDGQPVSNAKSLTGYVRRYKGGDQVTLKIARGGQVQEVQVTLTSQTS